MLAQALAATTASSSTASVASQVVSLAVLACILVRQRQVRILRARLVLPGILAVVGLLTLTSAARMHPLSAGKIAVLLALFAGDAIGLGAVRAYTVRLWHDGTQVLRQGSWLTIGLWLAGVVIHEGVAAAAHMGSSSFVLYMGATLGAQRLVLHARARHQRAAGNWRSASPDPGNDSRNTSPPAHFGPDLARFRRARDTGRQARGEATDETAH